MFVCGYFFSFLFIFHLIKSREKDLCVSVLYSCYLIFSLNFCGVRSVIVGWHDVDDLTELDAGHMSTFKIQIIHHTHTICGCCRLTAVISARIEYLNVILFTLKFSVLAHRVFLVLFIHFKYCICLFGSWSFLFGFCICNFRFSLFWSFCIRR